MHAALTSLPAVAIVLGANVAFAQTPAELVARAEEHADRGEWVAAADDFAALRGALGAGYAGAADLDYNEAYCRSNAGAYDAALALFARYIDATASETDRAVARSLVAEIEAGTARVAIDVGSVSADVLVDDVLVGHAPGTVRIAGGEDVTLEFRAPGRAPAHRTLRVERGATTSLEVELVARGDASAEAESRIARATVLFDQAQYDAALVELETAFDLTGGGGDAFQLLDDMARCEQRLGHFDRAVRDLRRYLEVAPPGDANRVAVEASLDALAGLLGTLTVDANVATARVFVDGRELGTTGERLDVPAGTHEVEIVARGRESERRTVQIAAGRDETLDVELHRGGSGIGPELFATLTSATGAALAVGVGLGASALVDQAAYARFGAGSVTRAESEELDRRVLAADILYGAAGALAISALVALALTNFGDAPGEPTLRPVVAPIAGGVIVGLHADM